MYDWAFCQKEDSRHFKRDISLIKVQLYPQNEVANLLTVNEGL